MPLNPIHGHFKHHSPTSNRTQYLNKLIDSKNPLGMRTEEDRIAAKDYCIELKDKLETNKEQRKIHKELLKNGHLAKADERDLKHTIKNSIKEKRILKGDVYQLSKIEQDKTNIKTKARTILSSAPRLSSDNDIHAILSTVLVEKLKNKCFNNSMDNLKYDIKENRASTENKDKNIPRVVATGVTATGVVAGIATGMAFLAPVALVAGASVSPVVKSIRRKLF